MDWPTKKRAPDALGLSQPHQGGHSVPGWSSPRGAILGLSCSLPWCFPSQTCHVVNDLKILGKILEFYFVIYFVQKKLVSVDFVCQIFLFFFFFWKSTEWPTQRFGLCLLARRGQSHNKCQHADEIVKNIAVCELSEPEFQMSEKN